ncbi:MAG: penicillin-binding protein activator [Sulfuriflexus sp.]|nr:penicillin-binding protein activator [Sulfuriflexus sp.]
MATLTACQTTGDEPISKIINLPLFGQSKQQAAEALETQGNYRGAADIWLTLAHKDSTSPQTQRDQYLLRATAALLQLPELQQAEETLAIVAQQSSSVWQITNAKLQLLLNKPADTLNILIAISIDSLSLQLLRENHSLQAKAYSRLGNHLEAANQRIMLDAVLDDALSRDSNHAELWADLNNVSVAGLSSIYAVTAPGHYRGWLELAILSQQAKQIGGTVQLDAWKNNHPLHPAVARFLLTLRNIEKSATPVPQQIALLLPLNGRIAEPARAVRDGFLAAYYKSETQKNNNTSIKLYDADATNIELVYQQAISDGADFVVGPLAKDAVNQLSLKESFTVPTLMLNANDTTAIAHSRLYQFALLPEDEARQVAERIWLEGHNKGIILYPESNWGERVRNAFQQHWLYLGGQLVDIQTYSLTNKDYAKPVRDVLNVDDSKQRFKQLRRVLGGKLEFEVRRRQDIDFVFLAAFPEQARQIRPQLKFYDASKIPVYATSHVYTGKIDRQRDRDMNGIIFGDMPWTIANQDQALKGNLAKLWRSRAEKLARFYAFGIDAYNIIPHLQRLQQYPFERYNGSTGSLRIDENLRLIRQLSWAKFRAGKPRLEALRIEARQPAPLIEPAVDINPKEPVI